MKEKNDLIVIGPSNGWLYAKNIFSLEKHAELLKRAKANAVELSLSNDNQKIKSLLSNEEIGEFQYLSLHLLDYDNSQSELSQISLIKKVFERRRPTACLIHPLRIPESYLEALASQGIPIVIENMDKDKDLGYCLEELEGLLQRFQIGFVLDVQHAYEHDSTMKYALDLFQMARDKLTYFHVSGETKDNHHVLVNKSENRKAITDFLSAAFSEIHAPIILEGEYTTADEVSQEINFLKSELI